MRWADLGPMPGSRPSSSMRSWTGTGVDGHQATELRRAGRRGHAAEAEHRRPASSLHLVDGVVQRREDEVLEHLDVVGVDRRRDRS